MFPAAYGLDLSHEDLIAEAVHVAASTTGAFSYKDLVEMPVDDFLGLLRGIEAAKEPAHDEE
jgi:hypothetical protein